MTTIRNDDVRVERVFSEKVFGPSDFLLYIPLSIVYVGVIGWFLFYWFSFVEKGADALPFITWTLVLVYSFAISLFRWALLPLMSRPKPMPAQAGVKVGVATTFVPGLESFEMLAKTVEALVAMKYPHETWVLDEGDDEKVKSMCARLGAYYFTRKDKLQYQTDRGAFEKKTKHGNYNAWLDAEGYKRYDIVIGFDPDHVPDSEFLNVSLGYFADPTIGYVQLPQAYYNQSAGFVARGAAEETYPYYSATQMSSYTFGFPIITGCHNIHRTIALKQVGGFAAHDADDLLITLLYRSSGWKGVYVPEIHARGLTPTDWPSYFKQQLRWAQSVIDVKFRAYPKVAGGMPLKTRIMSFLHGFYYVQEGVLGMFAVLGFVLMLTRWGMPKFMSWTLLGYLGCVLLAVTVLDFYRQRFFLDWRNEAGLHIRAGFLRFAKWPYIFLGLVDAVSGKKRPYSVTVKIRTAERKAFLTWPHLVVATLISAAWGYGAIHGYKVHPLVLVGAGMLFTSSLLVVWSETWRYPDPFDAKILDAEWWNRRK